MHVKKNFLTTLGISAVSMLFAGILIAMILLLIPFNDTFLGKVTMLEVLTSVLGAFSPSDAFFLFIVMIFLIVILKTILVITFYPTSQENDNPNKSMMTFLASLDLTASLLGWLFLLILIILLNASIFFTTTDFVIFILLSLGAFFAMGILSTGLTSGLWYLLTKQKTLKNP